MTYLLVRTTGQVTIRLGEQPFAYRSTFGDATDLAILFPGPLFTTVPTTYDGVWSFFFDVSTDQTDLIIWDGDLDRGTFTGSRSCSPQPQCLLDGGQDTDDADTLNDPFLPLFPITMDVRFEEVADGFNGTSGEPSDDVELFNAGIFVRSPAVRYDLIFPDGRVFGNENPSGNQEWEQFIVSTRAGCDPSPACVPDCDPSNPIDPSCPTGISDPVGLPCADACLTPGSASAAIPRGLYEVRIEGNDFFNLNALRLPQIVCVDDQGQACVPLRGLLLGDTVFLDDSGDGVQQLPAEPGINGAIVNLRGANGNLVGTTTTATEQDPPMRDGIYQFAVDQGTYTVEVAPENFAPAPAPGGSVGDLVWLDLNGDGAEDVGEPGIAGVKLNLFEVGSDTMPGTVDDVFFGSTQSGTNGGYAFTDLPPGTYFVDVVDASVPAVLSLFGGTDPSATALITIAGEDHVTLDFGYGNATAVVGDYVWSDANGDGVQDAGESGIGGVTLDLIDGTGAVVATATTKPDGSYLFTDVRPGAYTVAVTDTAGVLVTAAYTLTSSADFPSPTDSTVVVVGGDAFLSADFGYNNPSAGLGSITDLVYLDNDSSGTFTPGDTPLDGASVSLLNTDCAPTFFLCFGEVLATDVSGNDGVPGEVSFPDLPAGTYALRVLQLPPGSYGSSSAAAVNGFLDVVLPAGGAAVGTNFGYVVPDGAVTVGDRVWLDVNGDGIEDAGEPGLPNVHIELFEVGPDLTPGTVDDVFWDIAWTDRNGYYLFRNLFPGTWFTHVRSETVPAGLMSSLGFTNPSPTRTLAAGGAALDLDFPYTNRTHLVGDFVWLDANDDGVQDPGEAGIGGVTLTLTDLNGVGPADDRVVATTVTRSDGFYLFSAAAGDYSISVDPATVPAGLTLGTFSPHPETTAPFALGPPAFDLSKDFAYVNEAGTSLFSISDVVWFDPDHSGTFDGGESGIAGVTVDLLDARRGVTLSTIMDATVVYPVNRRRRLQPAKISRLCRRT